MKTRLITRTEIWSWFDSLFDEVLWSGTHLKIASAFRNVAKPYKAEIEKTSEFWTLTYYAHIDAAIFRLCRTYDKTSWSLECLLKTLRDKPELHTKNELKEFFEKSGAPERYKPHFPEIDPKTLAEDIKTVSSQNTLVANFRELRDKRFAHKTPDYVLNPQKLDGQYPFKLIDVETLYSNAFRILNFYGHAVIGSTGNTTGDSVADFKMIFESIKHQGNVLS